MAYDDYLRKKYRIALSGMSHSISKVLPGMVSKYGLDRNVKFWSYIRENPQEFAYGGPTASMAKSKSWGAYAERALGELGGPRYAPKPTADVISVAEKRMSAARRLLARRGGRRRTILTGELEPETSKRTLLG